MAAYRRLLQFALIGGAIFAISARARRDGETIALSREALGVMHDAEAARKGAAAPPAAVVDERAIEDEILYREGKKLGFEKDDPIVRQRVIQKTLFLAEELAGAGEPPTEAELRAFYASTKADWRRPEATHFVQVFARDRAELEAMRAEIARRVAAGEPTSSLGDPSPVPAEATMTRERMASMLGPTFADAVSSAPPGALSEPLESALGWHVVRVVDRAPGGQESFEEARASLLGVYVVKRREDAVAAFLARSFRDYDVTVDGTRVTALTPTRRVAMRTSGSAED